MSNSSAKNTLNHKYKQNIVVVFYQMLVLHKLVEFMHAVIKA